VSAALVAPALEKNPLVDAQVSERSAGGRVFDLRAERDRSDARESAAAVVAGTERDRCRDALSGCGH